MKSFFILASVTLNSSGSFISLPKKWTNSTTMAQAIDMAQVEGLILCIVVKAYGMDVLIVHSFRAYGAQL